MTLHHVVWQSYDNGINIEDIPEEMHKDVINFFMNIFFTRGYFKSEKYRKDQAFCDDFKNFVSVILLEGCSMILYNTITKKIMGATLLKAMIEEYRYWPAIYLIPKSLTLQIVLHLFKYMIDEGISENGKIDIDTVHVFALCLDPKYKGQNWKVELLKCASQMANSMRIPRITYVALTRNDQSRCIRSGMKEKYRIYFADYVDQITKIRPFQVEEKLEWYTMLYELHLTLSKPYNQMTY